MVVLKVGLGILTLISYGAAAPTCQSAEKRLESRSTFNHPGLLHNAADFVRIKAQVDAGEQPWLAGWYKLTNNSFSQLGYKASPVAGLCRGSNAGCTENYGNAYRDYAACYQHAIRWKISEDTRYADEAVAIINSWSSTMASFAGVSPDQSLAAGIYGYQYANCVELMRDYAGFSATNLTSAIKLLVDVYWPSNHAFLETHNGQTNTHYWANWDLCNMASALSIAIVADNAKLYKYAINYFGVGVGEGSINHVFWKTYPDGTAQVEEAGRDQGHTMLDLALLQPFTAAALNQGIDLWAYEDNLILKGAEYAAKYNLGNDVSFTPFLTYNKNGGVEYNQTVISPASRGDSRPIWEMYYNEYVVKRGLSAPYTQQYAALVRQQGGGAEGGGGNYGSNSGGFDQLGFGTLLYTLPGSQATLEYGY